MLIVFYHYAIFVGNCKIVDQARAVASIRYRNGYRQHMTVGILRKVSLPKAVVASYKDEWRLRIASEFVAVQWFMTKDVVIDLVKENLLHWHVRSKVKSETYSIFIRFQSRKHFIDKCLAEDHSKIDLISSLYKVYFCESPFVLIHVLHKILSDKKRMLAADVEAIVRCMSKMYV